MRMYEKIIKDIICNKLTLHRYFNYYSDIVYFLKNRKVMTVEECKQCLIALSDAEVITYTEEDKESVDALRVKASYIAWKVEEEKKSRKLIKK